MDTTAGIAPVDAVGCSSTLLFSIAIVVVKNFASGGGCKATAVVVIVAAFELEFVLEFAAVEGGDAVGCSLGGSLLTPPFNCIVESLWQIRFSTRSGRWYDEKHVC